MTVTQRQRVRSPQKTIPEPRWLALSTEERLEAVKRLAGAGLTEGEINAATGAANGAVRVICRRNGIPLTSLREKKLRTMDGEAYGETSYTVKMRIAARAAAGARRTRLEQFGGAA